MKFKYLWRSLKVRITILVLIISAIGIWSLTNYISLMLRTDLERLLGEQQLSTAKMIAKEIDQEIEFRLKALERIAKGIDPKVFANTARLQTFLESRLLLQELFSGGCYIIRTDGTAIADLPKTTGRIGMNVSDKTWMIEALKGKTNIGRPVIGAKLKVPVFTMATPIRDEEGRIIGVLAGVVNLSRLNFLDRITESKYGETGDYFIVAPQYRLVVTSSDKKRIMQPLPPQGVNTYIDRNIAGFEGFTILINTEGIEKLTSIKKIPSAGWYLAVALPTKEAFEPIHAMRQRMQIAAIIMIIAATLATWFVLRRQLFPIISTVNTLSNIANSDLPLQPIPIVRHDEVGQLVASFNSLIEKLVLREAKLRESEERHRSILRTAIDGIWLADMTGRIIEANEAYCNMSGYGMQEIVGMHISEIETEESAVDTERHMQLLKEIGHDRFQTRHRRKDGSVFDVEISVQYRTTEGGQSVAFIRDITERKRAEKELLDSQAKLQAAMASMNDAVFISDISGSFVNFNDAFAYFYRFKSKDECLEKLSTFTDIFELNMYGGEYVPTDMWPLARALRGEVIREARYRLHRKDTGERWIGTFSFAPISEKERVGVVAGAVVVAKDITEQINLENQLRHSQKMEAIGTLAGGIAHDFNNILTAILGYGTMVKMRVESDQKAKEFIEEVLCAASRAADLTKGLLAFSRKQTISLKLTDLNSIVKNIQKMLMRLIGEDIELKTNLYGSELPIIADRSQIEQVLLNLVTNARDAMPQGGYLSIQTDVVEVDRDYAQEHMFESPGRYALLIVSDTGHGMDKDTLENIFEPFFTTKEIGRGTGLGLAMVYGIVKQHEGNIRVYSEPGKGTTFRIYLPMTDKARVGSAESNSALPIGMGEMILMAEDEDSVRKIVKVILEDNGYKVIEAINGKDAVDKYKENAEKVSLLLMDVIMPLKNGREVYDEIRAIKPDIRALFMSGYTDYIIAKKGILKEGYEFISKPINPDLLLRRIRDMLDSNES